MTQLPARMPAGTRAQPRTRTRTHVPAFSHASARGGRCCFPSLFTFIAGNTRRAAFGRRVPHLESVLRGLSANAAKSGVSDTRLF